MIGTATREQVNVSEQPSVVFSAAVKMSNSALPVPLVPVTPNVSLLGRADLMPPVACGGCPQKPPVPPRYTLLGVLPFGAATQGTQYSTGAADSACAQLVVVDVPAGLPTAVPCVPYASNRYGG